MTRRPTQLARWALAGAAALASAPALAADPADLLDRAAACRRRAQHPCALAEADRALAALGDATDAAAVSLRREALQLKAEALALLDRPDDARAAFVSLLEAWPGWRPSPGSDPRVVSAVDAAEASRVRAGLPTHLDPGPPPLPPLPSAADLLPPPLLHAPPELMALAPADTRRRWRLGLGGGVALVAGRSADIADTGAVAALDLGFAPSDRLTIKLEAMLALHSLADEVRAEPGYTRGLTSAVFTLGVLHATPLGDGVDLVAGAGVGGGMFGLRAISEVPAFALQLTGGARYNVSPHFAVRLEALPVVFVPLGDGPVASHTAVVLRSEVRY